MCVCARTHRLVIVTESEEFGIFRRTTSWSGLSPTDASSLAAITRSKQLLNDVTDEFRLTKRSQQVHRCFSVEIHLTAVVVFCFVSEDLNVKGEV